MEDDETYMHTLVLHALQMMILVKRVLAPLNVQLASIYDQALDITVMRMVNRLARVSKTLKLHTLHVACEDIDIPITNRFPCPVIIKMLLLAGMDVNEKDSAGNTPLHAMMLSGKARIAAMKVLLEHGAALLARNNNNETCLDLIIAKLPRAVEQLELFDRVSLLERCASVVRRSWREEDYQEIVPCQLWPMLSLH
ncbi:unnamed protein product [Gongylonema pulchrum]|uniref:Uncharacterized protein n=1 Tax=Gongylonema pulchrum TaxID=637853 RepID=A0A3P7QHE2_9BILA|nr:unnamed protein product [Gongylonema pulchrum]